MQQPVGRQARSAGFAFCAFAALLLAVPPEPLLASAASAALAREEPGLEWVRPGDDGAARSLISLLESSALDGLDPASFKIGSLGKALRLAQRGDPEAVSRANAMLDRALLAYVSAMRRGGERDWIINDKEAVPSLPPPAAILDAAASSLSLEGWIEDLPFMHPSYTALRSALASAEARGDRASAERLRVNLERARLLPATGRYVMVNTAAQRLFMYEDGDIVDSMKVVVGKPHQPTPMMAATIKYTALNPYWNVPPDLAAERVAPYVVEQGVGYLKAHGYVVLSDWGEGAQPVDPASIDWEAVAAGRIQIRLRQNPGRNNAMGRMKFMFPNPQGVYLHDTPNKELLNEDARLFSGGCVRLEDAPRLAGWLHGRTLDPREAGTEQPVELPQPVPVYLIYQTAVPTDGEIVYYDDIYGKDRLMVASGAAEQVAVR